MEIHVAWLVARMLVAVCVVITLCHSTESEEHHAHNHKNLLHNSLILNSLKVVLVVVFKTYQFRFLSAKLRQKRTAEGLIFPKT
jgi:hypothetical protein